MTDQRFDLRRFLAPSSDAATAPLDGDATRARLALVEGDATLATLEVVDGSGAFLRPTALGALANRLRATAGEDQPPWLAEMTRFMHVDGFLFVARVRARQPWWAIDALWGDPPASSEQVLHRDKYESCENPIRGAGVGVPAAARLRPSEGERRDGRAGGARLAGDGAAAGDRRARRRRLGRRSRRPARPRRRLRRPRPRATAPTVAAKLHPPRPSTLPKLPRWPG